MSNCGRSYDPLKDGTYLGRFISTKPTYDGTSSRLYDLYYKGPDVLAIFGNDDDKIFIGDFSGKPIGVFMNWWSSPADVDENGQEALLEAAARKNI